MHCTYLAIVVRIKPLSWSILFTVNIVDQAFRGNDLLHELRECLTLEGSPFGYISYDTCVKIHFHFISGLNALACFWAFNDRESNVDGIAVKDAGEGFCYDAADAGCFDRNRGMLSGGAASEVFLGYDDITLFHFFDKACVDVFHAVGSEFRGVGGV